MTAVEGSRVREPLWKLTLRVSANCLSDCLRWSCSVSRTMATARYACISRRVIHVRGVQCAGVGS